MSQRSKLCEGSLQSHVHKQIPTVVFSSIRYLSTASYLGLLTPVFVACSTNAGKGLVKLIDVLYVDIGWIKEGVAGSFCTAVKWLSEPKKCLQDCQMSSAQSLHGPCLWSVYSTLTYSWLFWECATPPHVHPTSRYVLRGPGYEVTYLPTSIQCNEKRFYDVMLYACTLMLTAS